MENNIAILWDIQNVIPSKDNATVFLNGLINYAKDFGNISYALAVGDWKQRIADKIPILLSEKGFELNYIPQINMEGKKTKDSVDFVLITKATEMIFQYPHISIYLILAGDIDYRPLLQILKKHGKKIVVIYNPDNVSERLLELGDEYLDYRKLIPDDSDEYSEDNTQKKEEMDKAQALDLLEEAVAIMQKKGKTSTPGSIKVKMKMLNENFNGKIQGIKNWMEFINEANQKEIIRITDEKNDLVLSLPDQKPEKKEIPEIIKILLQTMKELDPKKSWIAFTNINNKLIEKNIRIKDYNYSKFKVLALDAEQRDLIETKNVGITWFARIK